MDPVRLLVILAATLVLLPSAHAASAGACAFGVCGGVNAGSGGVYGACTNVTGCAAVSGPDTGSFLCFRVIDLTGPHPVVMDTWTNAVTFTPPGGVLAIACAP